MSKEASRQIRMENLARNGWTLPLGRNTLIPPLAPPPMTWLQYLQSLFLSRATGVHTPTVTAFHQQWWRASAGPASSVLPNDATTAQRPRATPATIGDGREVLFEQPTHPTVESDEGATAYAMEGDIEHDEATLTVPNCLAKPRDNIVVHFDILMQNLEFSSRAYRSYSSMGVHDGNFITYEDYECFTARILDRLVCTSEDEVSQGSQSDSDEAATWR